MKGVYALVISVDKDISAGVGSLGKVRVSKGLHVYVGSAQNSLEKRVARHMRKGKKKFWHIDYLLDKPESRIEKVFWKSGKKEEECRLARAFSNASVKWFGCSDCSCPSHLLVFKPNVLEKMGMEEL